MKESNKEEHMKIDDINNIAIIGTGMIGASLAALFTGNGYRTTMLAMSERGEKTGLVRYQTHYQDLAQKGLVTEAQAAICRSYLTITRDIDAIRDADFIVECLAENLEIKHRIYQRVEEHCDKFRTIVSTTSAISPKDLCCKMKVKERLAVAHPYNPPHLVPCVEIVPSEYTSPETMQFIEAFLRSVGREPVMMQKKRRVLLRTGCSMPCFGRQFIWLRRESHRRRPSIRHCGPVLRRGIRRSAYLSILIMPGWT